MLTVSSDIVSMIIVNIREFQAKEGVTIPELESNPSDDSDWSQVLADHNDDLTYQELQSVINDLEPDQRYALIALLLVGRGDFDSEDFSAAIEASKDIELDHVAKYLLSVPLAASYLKEGLEALGYDTDI